MQSTRALLCLGSWSLLDGLDLVKDEDTHTVAKLDDVEGRIELQKVSQTLKIRTYV